jgi:hypothetical protein
LNSEFYEAFFAERDLIPPRQYCELAFDDLDRAPVESLRRVYETLDLPDFARAEPGVREYVASLRDYRKNELSDVTAAERERIAAAWQRCFLEWDYAP